MVLLTCTSKISDISMAIYLGMSVFLGSSFHPSVTQVPGVLTIPFQIATKWSMVKKIPNSMQETKKLKIYQHL